jgi:hypothetical protein
VQCDDVDVDVDADVDADPSYMPCPHMLVPFLSYIPLDTLIS